MNLFAAHSRVRQSRNPKINGYFTTKDTNSTKIKNITFRILRALLDLRGAVSSFFHPCRSAPPKQFSTTSPVAKPLRSDKQNA
jgi:hypothetical protein